jgi:DNA-binding transcriptional LysR family regulator
MGGLGTHQLLWSFYNPRQPDREGRATAGLALDRNVAAHHLTEAPTDGEAKASAAVFARGGRGRLRKLLEQLTHLLHRHSDAGIGNRENDPVAAVLLLLVSGNREGALFGELVAVAHEVQQRLAQPHLVGVNHPDRSVAINCELVAVLALKGLGIAYMSEFSVRDALEAGTLVTVLDEYTTEQNTFRLLWPSGKHITPKLRAFVDFVVEYVELENTHQ